MPTFEDSSQGCAPTDAAAQDARAHYRFLCDSLRDPFVRVAMDGRIVECNELYCQMLGYSAEELSRLTYQDLTPERWHATEEAVVREQVLARGYSEIYEKEYRRKDGTLFAVEMRTILERDAEGHAVCMWAIARDITERKLTEAALAAAKTRAETERRYLEAILQALPVGVIVTDAHGGVVLANGWDKNIWGPRPVTREIKDYAQYHAWWADSGQPVTPDEWASARAVREGEATVGQIFEIECFDGSHRYVHNSAVPIRDEQGSVIGCAVAIQDITELRRAEEALRAADRRKDEFLAILAHELRNPLAPIQSCVDLLQLRGEDPAVRNQAVHIMQRQVRHLVHLVDDLLDVSRISRGKIKLRKQRVDVADIVRASLETLGLEGERPDRRLAVTLPPQPLMMHGDPVRLAQVLGNLLSNSVKFTPPEGNIWLTVEAAGGKARISVRDNGEGIAPEILPTVFDMFVQADPSHHRGHGGLGIGLALVHSIVEMHGGRVSAHSEGHGKGSEFVVELPLAADAPERHEHATRAQGSTARRVLVVDDQADVADGMCLLLQALGAEAVAAYDGPSALAALSTHRPDLVLLDLGMAGMDGYEVARRMRAIAPESDLMLVAITGRGDDEAQRAALAAGFDRHLVKPVTADCVAALLQERAPAQ